MSFWRSGPTASMWRRAAFDELGILFGQMPIATFDLSPDVIQAIIEGNISVRGIHQQYNFQGYLPNPVFLEAEPRQPQHGWWRSAGSTRVPVLSLPTTP